MTAAAIGLGQLDGTPATIRARGSEALLRVRAQVRIEYTVDDGNGGTDTALVTVTVTGTNDGPVASMTRLRQPKTAALYLQRAGERFRC
ncbi:MAG: hypothetical protein ACYYKD_06700 [Rhodospirillales bacterium]